MKLIGIAILVTGLLLGVRALTMDVGIDVPAHDFGYGVATPAMKVANLDLMTQRQNYLIFSGILSIVGAILTGFAAMRTTEDSSRKQTKAPSAAEKIATRTEQSDSPSSVSICPKCRSMGPSDLTSCARCGAELGTPT